MDSKKIEEFDIIIIGGGIVGAGLFREQSLHGLSSLIVDQADFNSQTSQSSSKMLHGGIRYLENMDFALVFEALAEKNLWLKIAPHISKEIPFYLPVYKESKWPLFFMRIGLFLYDLLSLFKNSPHKVLNIKQAAKALPGLKENDLRGCGMYFDGIVDDSKLGLECIYDGLRNEKCKALNYHKVTQVTEKDGKYIVQMKHTLDGHTIEATSKHVIFATGPFTDKTMKSLNIPWSDKILPSKGTHLWLKQDALKIKDAMVLQTKDQRIIFVIPQRKAILVGTTEKIIDKEEMLNIKASQEEIDYLLSCVNEYFPSDNVTENDIINSYAGIRPLVKSSESSHKTSRKHKIFTPQKNMHVLIGGKYTTFRKMAEELNSIIFRDLGIRHDKSLTKNQLRTTSIVKDPFDHSISKQDIENILTSEYVRTKDDLITRRLSLPSSKHLNNKELETYIEELKFIKKED